MGYYCALMIISTILHVVYKFPLKNEEGFFATAMRDSYMAVVLQLFAVFTQLMIIVGLCLDGGKSFTTRFLNTRFMQFLGRISMALYLVHMPVMSLVNLCIYGVFINEPLPDYARLPLWSTPIQIIVSLITAAGLTMLLEEPAKKKLKELKTPQNSSKFSITGALFFAFGILVVAAGNLVFRREIIL